MLKRPSRRNRNVRLPMSSMGDIAFLLLIFFLVVTTIGADAGIQLTLPPPVIDERPPIKDRNLLSILVNRDGAVLVEGQPMAVRGVRGEVVRHVTNPMSDVHLAQSPRHALVSIQTDAATPYAAYVEVLDEVMMAYRAIHDRAARRRGYVDYTAYKESLKPSAADEIQKACPVAIALPTSERY